MKFDEIYKPPFHDSFGIGVSTKDGIKCFHWVTRITQENKQIIIDILNGVSKEAIKGEIKYSGDCFISINGVNVMLIRGWGHLTGCGALKLPSEEAIKIQDDFGEWIVKKLKQEI